MPSEREVLVFEEVYSRYKEEIGEDKSHAHQSALLQKYGLAVPQLTGWEKEECQ